MKFFVYIFAAFMFSVNAFAYTPTIEQIVDIAKSPAVIKLVDEQKSQGRHLVGFMIEAWTNCNGRSLYHINFIEFSNPTKICFAELQAGICPPHHNDAVSEPGEVICK